MNKNIPYGKQNITEDDLKSVSDDWGKLGKPKLDAEGFLILKRI